jgi:hypothetical protein
MRAGALRLKEEKKKEGSKGDLLPNLTGWSLHLVVVRGCHLQDLREFITFQVVVISSR